MLNRIMSTISVYFFPFDGPHYVEHCFRPKIPSDCVLIYLFAASLRVKFLVIVFDTVIYTVDDWWLWIRSEAHVRFVFIFPFRRFVFVIRRIFRFHTLVRMKVNNRVIRCIYAEQPTAIDAQATWEIFVSFFLFFSFFCCLSFCFVYWNQQAACWTCRYDFNHNTVLYMRDETWQTVRDEDFIKN